MNGLNTDQAEKPVRWLQGRDLSRPARILRIGAVEGHVAHTAEQQEGAECDMSWAETNSVPGDTNDITWTVNEFHRLVNMSPEELARWEATPQSRAAPDSAFVARIAGWLRTRTPQLTAGDLHDMVDAIDYIREHVANPPRPDPLHPDALARWRDALKNHGHDPEKDPGH